jgi:two-component sensor histidine kinase
VKEAGRLGNPVVTLPLAGSDASEAQSLVAIIRRLSVARTLDEVVDVVTHAARTLLRADGISFVLRDGDRCHYVEESAIAPLWKGQRFPMNACVSGWCMEQRRSVSIPDIYKDARIPKKAYRPTFVRSLAMAPVRQEEPIAALGAYWSTKRDIQPAELELLQTVANAASLAIAYVQARGEQTLVPRGRPSLFVRPARRLLFLRSLADQRRRSAGSAPSAKPLNQLWMPKPPAALWRRILIGLCAVGIAWALRLAAGPMVGTEAPYATFFLAVLVASLWGGREAGVCALVAGGLLANLAFVSPAGELHLNGTHLGTLLVFWVLAGAVVVIAELMTGNMRREIILNRRLEMVGRELQHRIKNFITVAQALAQQTGRNAQDMGEFEHKFGERLHALAGAQSLLSPGKGGTAPLDRLVAQILDPYQSEGHIQILGGPDHQVDEQLAVAIALLLNELATNAIKYGALSVPGGCVDLLWKASGDRIRLKWLERGGPPVSMPERGGFGSRLMKAAMPRSRGSVDVHYDPEGLRCEIAFASAPC